MFRIILVISLFAVSSLSSVQAGLIVFANHSFEGGQSGDQLNDMTFTGSFGAQDSSFYGLSTDNPRTGTFSHAVDLGTNGSGPGFGGNFSTFNITGLAGTLASTDSFTVSAYFASDPADPFVGGGEVNVHLEFYESSGSLIVRTDSLGLQPRFLSSDITTSYQQLVQNYTLGNAAQIPDALLVNEVRAVISASNGGNTGDGRVFVDDFVFSGNLVSAVPEPTSFLLVLTPMAGLAWRRRTRQIVE